MIHEKAISVSSLVWENDKVTYCATEIPPDCSCKITQFTTKQLKITKCI